MRAFTVRLGITGVVCLATSVSPAGGAAPAAVKTLLEREGFGGSPLHRRFGNHLFVDTLINRSPTGLMIDSGCPITLIDRSSAKRLGLQVTETRRFVGSVTGHVERYGVSTISTLVMGNCTFQNVPVEVANEGQINLIARPHLDGLFGVHEMAKFGMIIDCARQMIYVNPKGPSASASLKLGQFLAARGFTRISMRLNSQHHLEIDAKLNSHPIRLLVDTGSGFSLISSPIAVESGASMSHQFFHRGTGIAHIGELNLGGLVLNNAEVATGNVAKFVGAGILGEEYLSWNFGIVDVGGMNLYLRTPESKTPAKKR